MLGSDKVIVTIFPDDNKKYLSTDLLNEEPVKSDFLSTDVELISFNAYKRVCHTCCEPDSCAEHLHIENGLNLPRCVRRD